MKLRVPGTQALAEPQDDSDFRAAGDRARNRGDWAEAVTNYKAHLARKPGDFEIWVQLGHAAKETGNHAESRGAYTKAIELRPNDFDVRLNMGHLEKLAGQRDAAITAYKKAFQLNPKNTDALREIVGLEGDVSDLGDAVAQGFRTIYVDMTDLIVYVQTNASLSGIQRVVANLIEGIDAFTEAHQETTVIPVIPEYDKGRILAVNRHLVLAMIESLQKGGTGIQKAVDAVYASRTPVKPKKGDIFTIAGAFWIYPHYDMLQRLREDGVKFIIFIHDLIQISHPQYVHQAATAVFRRALIDVLKLANGVLTNTEFVAQEVRQFMRDNLNFEIPVKAVFLSTELAKPSKSAPALNDKVQDVLREPYVLSVSTIEVRKNHMYMIRVWQKLIHDKTPNIPNLVFVGKMGWDIEPFVTYMDESDQLGGRLRVLNGITDEELSELYKRSMFTMFPSFVEGFGLPVGESLAHGKPVISSNRSSMPEVGGKFARYVNPEDVYEGVTLVRDLITHPDKLAQWTAEVEAGYRPKSWRDFAVEYLEAATEVSKGDDRPVNGHFEAGDVIGMGSTEVDRRGDLGRPLTYLASGRRTGWHAVEPWGCWSSTRRATLYLPTALKPDTDVTIYLCVQTPGHTEVELAGAQIDVGGRVNVYKRLQPRRHWLVAEGKTDAQGGLPISLLSIGKYDRPDTRELYLGLAALGFCASDDTLSRLKIIERIALQSQG